MNENVAKGPGSAATRALGFAPAMGQAWVTRPTTAAPPAQGACGGPWPPCAAPAWDAMRAGYATRPRAARCRVWAAWPVAPLWGERRPSCWTGRVVSGPPRPAPPAPPAPPPALTAAETLAAMAGAAAWADSFPGHSLGADGHAALREARREAAALAKDAAKALLGLGGEVHFPPPPEPSLPPGASAAAREAAVRASASEAADDARTGLRARAMAALERQADILRDGEAARDFARAIEAAMRGYWLGVVPEFPVSAAAKADAKGAATAAAAWQDRRDRVHPIMRNANAARKGQR